MKFISKLGLMSMLFFALQSMSASSTGIIVVANTDLTNISVEKRQVRDIFMKSSTQFDLNPVTLKPNNQVRLVFNTKVVGLTESRIQSYWAQMRFSGKKRPPREFDSIQAMLLYLQNNKNTVTYLPANVEIPEGLTVIYKID